MRDLTIYNNVKNASDKSMAFERWEGCYDKSLTGYITSSAFAHPAKFSLGLIERILDHMLKRKWIKKGDLIGDPFAGVGVGGIAAAYRGLLYVGMELEPRFVEMAKTNFALHKARWRDACLGDSTIVQGDSRRFHERFMCEAICTSPPFRDARSDTTKAGSTKGGGPCAERLHTVQAGTKYGEEIGQIDNLKSGSIDSVITSPPYAETGGNGGGGINVKGYVPADGHKWTGDKPDPVGSRTYQGRAGKRDPASIETLKQGRIDAIISSPPYADIAAGAGGLNTKPATKPGQQSGRSASSASQTADQKYGDTPGQISKLEKGPVDAIVSSPPWEDNAEGGIKGSKVNFVPTHGKGHGSTLAARQKQLERDEAKVYGDSEGQIGKLKAQTYWEAMRDVYSSALLALKPGGYAAIVLKDYAKDGKRVCLCDDTVKLLEHLGFVTVERIHAMLTRETVESDLFTGTTKTTRSKKSFFRRLYEKRPNSVQIDWEEVIICQKPEK